MNKIAATIAIFLCFLFLFVTCSPIGRGLWNSWFGIVQKVDDHTSYGTRKMVEDSCRAMIASYTSDKMTYETYKDSEIGEERSWSKQAKMRANKTAASYNEYVLKNSYVWKNGVPLDIRNTLPYLE